MEFNKSTIKSLDTTYDTIDGRITITLAELRSDINKIHETSDTTAIQIFVYVIMWDAHSSKVYHRCWNCSLSHTPITKPAANVLTDYRTHKTPRLLRRMPSAPLEDDPAEPPADV